MTAVTYEQMAEQRDRLDHWVLFVNDISSDEWTDHIRALFNAGSSAASMNEEAAKTIFDILENELKVAREDWLQDSVDEYALEEPAVVEVYKRLCETGKREWPRKPTNRDVKDQLARCGDGSHDAPWKSDELVKLAKMLRSKGF